MSFGGPHLIAPLSSMLGLRPGMNVSVIGAPPGFMEALAPLPEGVSLVDTSKLGLDLQVLFATRKLDLIEKLALAPQKMAVLGAIWVCYPTGADPNAPSEDFVRLAALELGLTDTKKLILDPAWEALRLQWKPRPPRPEIPSARA